MKRKTILFCVFLGLSLSALIIFAIGLYSEIRIGFKTLYIAKDTLNQRTIIQEDDLVLKKVPKDYIGEEVLVEKEEIVGKVVKMNHSIVKGSFFYKEAIEVFDGEGDLLHLYLKEDEVTFDVNVHEVKVNPLYLKVGMITDLYLTIQKDYVMSDLLLSDVRIVGLFKDLQGNVETISFAILAKDVNVLNKAIALGTLSIVVGQDSYESKASTFLHEDTSVFAYLENQS